MQLPAQCSSLSGLDHKGCLLHLHACLLHPASSGACTGVQEVPRCCRSRWDVGCQRTQLCSLHSGDNHTESALRACAGVAAVLPSHQCLGAALRVPYHRPVQQYAAQSHPAWPLEMGVCPLAGWFRLLTQSCVMQLCCSVISDPDAYALHIRFAE